MDRLEAFRSIAAQASRGEITLSTNINATLKVKQMLDDPDAHLAGATKLVLADPLFSARTVSIANSAAYNRSGTKINNVTTAVMRLGFGTLRSLAASLIVRQMNNGLTNPIIKQKSAELWEHTACVAALAQVIARRMTRVDPDAALFAGIVHEVGGFYLLSRAEEFPGLLDGELEGWVEYGEKIIGRGVLKALDIPETICEAIEQVWNGVGAQPPVTLGDVLILANDLATTLSPLQPASEVAIHDADTKVDFNVGDETLSSILDDATEQIESLREALLG
ncbi:HDOD domain-containing protein [Solimicrobium silvestre]|uniref:Putative signal transduction protein n=1 Tax=Solimicrobium silvestre TaxID=2099400 RepID=A0A2S9GZL5_9BURK|nr:HDOD domain-containing protein [Solimicrobium silvestre]PRC93179.1 putative signal transduction protein [Solimicrobium silvestre]